MTAADDFRTWLPERLYPFWPHDEVSLLRALIVGEAEGETYLGKLAVACVVRNRVRAPWWWGHDVRTVILWRHQFSCFWSDYAKREKAMLLALTSPDAYEAAHRAATDVLAGSGDITDGAMWYFNRAVVTPSWAAHLIRTVRIGHHDFYGYGR